MRKTGKCCLCGAQFRMYGCNPWPLASAEDQCCHACDREHVIPARLKLFFGTEGETEHAN
jgi:hypothetical protein